MESICIFWRWRFVGLTKGALFIDSIEIKIQIPTSLRFSAMNEAIEGTLRF